MALSMETYQGHEKLPYCKTCYSSTKLNAVADTPVGKFFDTNTHKTHLNDLLTTVFKE